MRIKATRFNIFSFKVAKIKKIAALAIILTIATISGYSAFKHFAVAQNGDFVDNVKTFMEMVSKKDDNSEKTEFYSGEDIIMNSRIEASSEGSGKSYPNAYFLLKVPKKYLKNNPRITATSAIVSSQTPEDGDYYIYRGNYKELRAGSINSINYIITFKNPETPENYKPEIIHELYDENNNLLSKQSKTLNTLKYQLSFRDLFSVKSSAPAAVYTNKEKTKIKLVKNTDIDVFTLTSVMVEGNNTNIGIKPIDSIVYKITLAEYMKPSPESIQDGWTFDETTRVATINRSRYQLSQYNYPYKDLKVRYAENTPESILNKKTNLKSEVTVNYSDGTSTNVPAVTKPFTPTILNYPDNGLISLKKESRTNNLSYRYNGKTIDGAYTSYALDIDSVDNNTESKINEWDVDVNVLNDGSGNKQPINYIKDKLNNDEQYIDSVRYNYSTNGFNPFSDLGISKLDVYAIDAHDVETKVGEMTKNSTKVSLPYGSKGFRLQFPENTKIPSDVVAFGSTTYWNFKVVTKFFDVDKIRNSLSQQGQEYVVKNSAFISLDANSPEKEAKAIAIFEKDRKLVTNNIEQYGTTKQPITTSGGQVDFYGQRNSQSIKNPVYYLLFSDNLGIGDKAQECIDQGSCSIIRNYKNTGKQLLKITNVDNLDNYDFYKYFVSKLIKVVDTTTNGEYTVDFITTWDPNDQFRYGNGNDDLDFSNDGSTNSTNIARSSTKFIVLKPEQVAIKKYVRKHNSGNFENSVTKLNPGDLVDYQISIINISDRPLLTSRALEVLPTANDKKIVENNQGVQEDRGSQFPVRMTGPLKERNGFKIKYSTEEPGSNQTESWNKNFVDKDAISDWSKVRMIKIEQEQGFEIPAQTVENFDFAAQIDPNAADNAIANNSIAVTINASGNLVESDVVTTKIGYPAVVEGIAFEDNNKNNVYDENIDTLLPNYRVELFKDGENTPSQTVKTDAQGHYRFYTKDFTTHKVKFTKDNAIETVVGGDDLNEKASHVATNSTDLTVESSTFRFTDNNKHYVRNIGVFRRRGSVEVKFIDQNNNELQNKVTVKDNALISESYAATKPNEITKDNLVYVFEKLKDGSAPETGNVTENTQTVTFVYKPKEGGKVEAKFVKSGTNQEISAAETVKPAGVQVGTEYTATSKPEIVENGLKYVYNKVAANSASQNGRVKVEAQNVIFEYTPKAGKPVSAISKIVGTNEIIKNVTVAVDGTQVGTPYSNTPTPEITHNGITYVYNSVLKDSAPSVGNVSEQEQTILYGYVPKKGGQVLAKYLDQNGNAVKNMKIVKATDTPVGTNYSDEPDSEITTENGLVYTFEKIKSGSKTGKVEANSKEIVYQYKPKLGKGVNVRLITSKDKAILDEIALEKDGKQIGTTFSYTHPKEVTDKKGLVYEAEANAKAVNGKISGESQTFEISYKPKKGGRIEAKFINQDGEEIQNAVEIAKAETQVGTDYSSKSPKEITKDGLVYVFEKIAKDSAPEIGKVKTENQTITYIYTPKKGGSVIERFIDQNGNPIQPNNILHKAGTQVGTPFESNGANRIEINGRIYELKKVEGKQKGNVEENEIFINYIFEDVTKISAPNTGVVRNISIFVIALATIILSIITVRAFKKRITF